MGMLREQSAWGGRCRGDAAGQLYIEARGR